MAARDPNLDLVVQLQIAGALLSARGLAALVDEGFDDLRVADGYWFQHLVTGARPISELAARMGITQQGASKAIADLEARGYVAREPGVEDRRARLVRLTERGEAAVAAARAVRKREQARLRRRVGAAELHRFERTLGSILDAIGGPEAIAARNVPSSA